MDFKQARVLLTGASGGIGQIMARELGRRGARLALVDVQADKLGPLVAELEAQGIDAAAIVSDLTLAEGRDELMRQLQRRFGGADLLINNAGIMAFTEFSEQDPAVIERMLKINVVAPMQLTRALLPDMLAHGSGHIVNIGSTFGSIAFAFFASYSASKFAMRGFSEALRRELDGSGIKVTYVAPRAVKTPLNSPAVYRMAQRVKMNMDEPSNVVQQILHAIEKDKKDVYLGFPESLFVRINALLPRLVDTALRKQNRIMREFTHEI